MPICLDRAVAGVGGEAEWIFLFQPELCQYRGLERWSDPVISDIALGA